MVRGSVTVFVGVIACAACLSGQTTSKEKIKAIQKLAKQEAGVIPDVAGYLKDADPEVRREAALAIGTLGTIRALEPLAAACGDSDDMVKIRATDGIVNFYVPGYLKRGLSGRISRMTTGIREKFGDTNDQVIDSHVTVRSDVAQAVTSIVGSPSPAEVRANAARALGILRARSGVPALVDAAKSKDSLLIYESLVALQKIGDVSAGPGVQFLLLDPDERVQIAAVDTAGILRNRQALPLLREAYSRTTKPRVRAAVLTSVAMMADEASRPLLESHFADRDERMRAASAEGIGRLRNASDLARIGKAFESESKMRPRLALAFAASLLGNREMSEFSPLQYLVNSLNSTSWNNIASAFLVELLREPEIRAAIHPQIPRFTKVEKVAIAPALGAGGGADSLPILETLMKDQDPAVGEAAARALQVLRARL